MSRVRAFANDDLRFDVSDEGPEDGDVVVLLHGFPQRYTSWRDVVPRLHDAGYRTLGVGSKFDTPEILAVALRRQQYALVFVTFGIVALTLGTVVLHRRDAS